MLSFAPDTLQPDGQPKPVVVDALAVSRGSATILAGLRMRVAPGQACIVRGQNGAGKTTLLRTLAGLQPPLSGTIEPGPDAMGYASHADGLKATLTVEENLTFWARMHGHQEISQAVLAFNLRDLVHRPAGTLSAGQKRRLGLARLCVTRRPIWLLDEPTVSLDSASVALFADTVRAHLAQGGLAIIATHIDLGLDEAQVLDVTPFRTSGRAPEDRIAADAFDEDDGAAYL